MRAEIKSHFNGPYLEVTPETDAEKAWMDDFKKTRKNRKILVHFGRGKMRVFDRTKVEESIFQTLFPSLKLRARIKKINKLSSASYIIYINPSSFAIVEYDKRYVIECRIVEGIMSDLSFLLAFTYINMPNVNAIYSTEHKAWRIHFSAQNKTVYYRRVRVYKSERELHVIANKCK